jgi:EAL domain-containing protein (putative c-di-GMP-specific phosphodiesterase class I)
VRGPISPAEFIPVAEEMGLIVEMGAWALRQACLECARWPDDVGVAVNLSPIQFRHGSVESAVEEALAVSGLAPERLELEITETVLLQDTSSIRDTLERLRDMGVGIALDDFGTGYSSLGYLHSFPLNKVKIDRCFLAGIESDPQVVTLLRGVARLSAELGMSVVMEGVETQQQLALVSAEKSISHIQGYLFAAPMSGTDIRRFLSADRKNANRVVRCDDPPRSRVFMA